MSSAIRTDAAVAPTLVVGPRTSSTAYGGYGSSVLALPGLLARNPAAPLLSLDTNGVVVKGPLAHADIPAGYTRRDVAEPISEPWTWDGDPICWTVTGVEAPHASRRSLGTKLVLYPIPGGPEFAIGIEPGALWTSVPSATPHLWYQGTQARMQLTGTGILSLDNGAGELHLTHVAGATCTVKATNAQLNVLGASGLSLQAGATTGAIYLQTGTGAASGHFIQPTAGYRENLGSINFKYLTVHAAELWVETLVAADTMATIGGRVIVAPTTSLAIDLPAGAPYIVTKHNNYAAGDLLWLEAGGYFEIMRVANAPIPWPSNTAYWYADVTRNVDGSGASIWYAGDALVNTGQINNGFIDLYSVRGVRNVITGTQTEYGPTIAGNVRYGTGATDWRPRWAIGRLAGLYGFGGTVYGAAFGDATGAHVSMTAEYGIIFKWVNTITAQFSPAGAIILGRQDQAHASLDSVGLAFRGADSQNKLLLDGTTGDLMLTGNIRSGPATNYSTGTGFFLGWNSNNPVFRIGAAPTGQNRRLEWTGSSLRLVSDGLSIDENGVRLANGGSGDYGRHVSWGVPGPPGSETTRLYDDGAIFSVWKRTGMLRLINNDSTSAGKVRLQAGEAGTQQHYLELTPTSLVVSSGTSPTPVTITLTGSTVTLGKDINSSIYLHGSIFPWGGDNTGVVGNVFNRWQYFVGVNAGLSLAVGTWPSHTLHLGTDDAHKATSSTWTFGCDPRAKRDVAPLDLETAVCAVRDTRLVRFTYNGAFGTPEGAESIGVDAAEAARILPRSVTAGLDGLLGWNAHELLMCTVAAVQSLLDRLEALETRS